MLQKNKMFVAFIFLCALVAFLWLVNYIFSPYVNWKEEVKLSDGRIIQVEQKRRDYHGIAADSWLTIDLPDISSHPIEWHEALDPLVVNIDSGKLYVVGIYLNGEVSKKYGCHQESYVNFVWNKGIWVRIPFDKIPESIYKTNMLIDDFPPKGTSFLRLGTKNSEAVNGRGTLSGKYKLLNPELGNC